MSAWGTALFSDDFAKDVRDDYVEKIILGKTNEEATEYVKQTSMPKEDDEDYPVFWIALAVTQWKKGRLLDDVRQKALEVLDSGGDLERWLEEGPEKYEKRKKVLADAKELLLSPMPPAKKLTVPAYLTSTPWKIGDVISYKLACDEEKYSLYAGKYVLLRITDHYINPKGVVQATVAIYAWCGSQIPENLTIESIQKIPYLKVRESFFEAGSINYNYFGTEYIYFADQIVIALTKRDAKQRETTVLLEDPNFRRANDIFLQNGRTSGNPYPMTKYDYDIPYLLEKHNILPDAVKLD